MHRLLLLPLLLATAALASPRPPEAVELKSGTKLLGTIVEEECSDELLVIREIRSQAKRRIPWEEIEDEQAHRLRVELGFEVEESVADALLIDGHRIVNRSGNTFEGVLQNADRAKRDGEYLLKTSQGVMRIRVADVRALTPIRISAVEVYTPLELYETRRQEMEPLDTAEKHFLLAEYARTVEALEQALSHYDQALALEDPKYPPAKLQRLIDMVTKLLASQEARDELKEIKQAIWHKRFPRAAELIAAFKERHADDEQLLGAVANHDEDLVARRTEHYTTIVPKMVRDTVRDLLDSKVKEKELTLRQLQQYAGGEVSAEDSAARQAVDLIAEKEGLPPEEVLEFWNGRSRSTSLQRAFYRDGTFIVVENLQDALARAPKAKPTKGGPKPPKPHKPVTPEEWWKAKVESRKFSELRDWAYAYWAEKSGMCELIEPKDATCPVCAGKGYVMQIFQSSLGTIPYADRCGNCHMATFHRVVRFR